MSRTIFISRRRPRGHPSGPAHGAGTAGAHVGPGVLRADASGRVGAAQGTRAVPRDLAVPDPSRGVGEGAGS